MTATPVKAVDDVIAVSLPLQSLSHSHTGSHQDLLLSAAVTEHIIDSHACARRTHNMPGLTGHCQMSQTASGTLLRPSVMGRR